MSTLTPELRLDWCSGKAARYACERWHYTGAILFGIGAGRSTDGRKYGLARANEVAELVRVALKPGHAHSVTRCVSIAIRMLRRQSPNLRLLISFADPQQGHHGGIYQGGNWLYTGETDEDRSYIIRGQPKHPKTIHSNGWKQNEDWLRRHVDPNARCVRLPGKHRYLYPLDDEIRERVAPLAVPFPKRAKDQAADPHSALGGETPTRTLQIAEPANAG